MYYVSARQKRCCVRSQRWRRGAKAYLPSLAISSSFCADPGRTVIGSGPEMDDRCKALAIDDLKKSRVGHLQMRMTLHWTVLLLAVLAVAPIAAQAALRL